MLEGVDVEVGVELAVHANEQVAVESGGHAERIVIGEQEVALRFHQVGANQQRVARPQRAADRPQKLGGARRIEVADVRSEEQRPASAAPVMARQGFEPRFVRRLMASRPSRRDALSVRVARSSAADDTSTRWTVSDAVDRAAPTSIDTFLRFQARARPSSTAAQRAARISEACAASRRRSALRDRIPRQLTDRLEERRAERIVEVPRRQLLRIEPQVVGDVVCKRLTFEAGWRCS